MIHRAEVRTEIHRLRSLTSEVSPKITLVGKRIDALTREIAETKALADAKAESFRGSYEEAERAYEEGDHDEATAWSLDGGNEEEECRALNEMVGELCARHKELCRIHQSAVRFTQSARSRINLLSTRVERSRVKEIIGFRDTNGVREGLDQFPPAVTALIGRVERIPEGQPTMTTSGAYRAGGIKIDKESGKYVISFIELFTTDTRKEQGSLWLNLFHEMGHIFWDRFVRPEEKQIWEKIYTTRDAGHPTVSGYAERSTRPEEDFCETLAYHTAYGRQRVDDCQRADLIETITSRVDIDLQSQIGLQPPEIPNDGDADSQEV